MKAITLWEPWASLMAIGAKVNETRGVRTKHRGDIAVHAALKTVDGIEPEVLAAFRNRGEPMFWQFGCIVAVVELWDAQPSEACFCAEYFDQTETDELVRNGQIPVTPEEWAFGNYSEGRFIYRTRNLRRLATPVPCRGSQAIGWTVPPDVEAKVKAQL